MKEVFHKVTGNLIARLKEIEAGNEEARWFKPWTASGMPQFPTNELTRQPYHGLNALLLYMTAMDEGYSTNQWCTFKQKDILGHKLDAEIRIRKGEHGYPVFKYVDWVPKEFKELGNKSGYLNAKTGEVKQRDEIKVLAMRQYVVFNLDQMDGVPEDILPPEEEPNWEIRYLAAKEFCRRMTCKVHHGKIDKAYYAPSKHFIRMPGKAQFKTEGGYYATLFHEHVHSTGKELGRDLTGEKGTDSYAEEELVAEIGSAILCAQYGIEAPVQHPEYIHGYIRQLQDHDRAFWKAAVKAQAAVNLLMEQSMGQAA